jgi:hypothetical protein
VTRRFVVLRHVVHEATDGMAEVAHVDLMVEDGVGPGALVTFQLDAPPPARGRRSFDHRPRYLDYEGPISGGRGRVERLDAGRVEDVEGDPRAARWRARFEGARLLGLHELRDLGVEGVEVVAL